MICERRELDGTDFFGHRRGRYRGVHDTVFRSMTRFGTCFVQDNTGRYDQLRYLGLWPRASARPVRSVRS